jgi:hypothetical protein
LVVILFAGLFNENSDEIPCILLFDSLIVTRSNQETISKTINCFVKIEWKKFFSNKDNYKDMPIFNIENAVKQSDGNCCGYCSIFNTQNVLKLISCGELVASEKNISTKFSKLITEEMKESFKGYKFPLVENIIAQKEEARKQLCTWVKYLSPF